MPELSTAELAEIYAFAVRLGKDAGDILMGFARARWGDAGASEHFVTEKDSSVDIVTKADEGALPLVTWDTPGC
jgi:myo-inositol-1(or 4)-monophosphatase